MKNIILIIVFLLSLNSNDYTLATPNTNGLIGNWQISDVPFNNFNISIKDIKYFNKTDGLIGCDYPTIGNPSILVTTDAGVNWNIIFQDTSIIKIDSITGNKYYDFKPESFCLMQILNSNMVICLANNNYLPNKPYFIISKDLGNTWQKFFLPQNKYYINFKFIDTNNVFYAIGDSVFSSTNCGLNWKLVCNFPIVNNQTMFVSKIDFQSKENFIALLNDTVKGNSVSKVIAYTESSGANWKYQKLPDSLKSIFNNICFLDNKIWLSKTIFINNDSIKYFWRDLVYFSTDYGKSWKKQLDTVNMRYYRFNEEPLKIKFLSSEFGVLYNNSSNFYVTYNGGDNWINLVDYDKLEWSFRPEVLSIISNDYILFGNPLVNYTYIFKGLINDVNNNVVSDSKKIHINPVPALSFIDVNLSDCSLLTKLEIFDIKGIKYKELTPKISGASSDKIRIDVSDFKSGVYFVKAGNIVQKFVKF